MAKGKPAAAAKSDAPVKSKKPKFKGINHPRNLPKAFRSSGNRMMISATLDFYKKK